MKTNQGFSLVELMITVGIIGILTTMAMPMYGDYMARIRLTSIFKSIMHIQNILSEEFDNTDPTKPSFAVTSSIADQLCIEGTRSKRQNGSDFIISCQTLPIFDSFTQSDHSSNSIPLSISTSYGQVYLTYSFQGDQGYRGHDFFSILIRPGAQQRYIILHIALENIKFYSHGHRPSNNGWDNSNQMKFNLAMNPSVEGNSHPSYKYVPKGTTEVKDLERGRWYCGVETYSRYTMPNISALPIICKNLLDAFIFYEI